MPVIPAASGPGNRAALQAEVDTLLHGEGDFSAFRVPAEEQRADDARMAQRVAESDRSRRREDRDRRRRRGEAARSGPYDPMFDFDALDEADAAAQERRRQRDDDVPDWD